VRSSAIAVNGRRAANASAKKWRDMSEDSNEWVVGVMLYAEMGDYLPTTSIVGFAMMNPFTGRSGVKEITSAQL
jgi:hypothetical protein